MILKVFSRLHDSMILTRSLVACQQQHACGINICFLEHLITLAEAAAWCLPGTGTPEASVHLPVVVSIIPVVKVHQKAIVHHISHCGNTDQGRIHAVHSLKLHAHLKAWRSLVLGGERGRFLSQPRLQRTCYCLPCPLQKGTCPRPDLWLPGRPRTTQGPRRAVPFWAHKKTGRG